MPEFSAYLRQRLVRAYQILIAQGVLETFGHVSVRVPESPDQFLLPVAGAPAGVRSVDLLAFDLAGKSTTETDRLLFSERYIHAAIYRARPDVMSVCHHHSPSVMPFCVAGVALEPVSQTGAAMGAHVPFWDSRAEFGDTPLLVNTPGQAESLARALGSAWMVLMRRHGATVVGRSLEELVFRAVHACRDADYQLRARVLGEVQPLSQQERQLAGELRHEPILRCWQHWEALLPDFRH